MSKKVYKYSFSLSKNEYDEICNVLKFFPTEKNYLEINKYLESEITKISKFNKIEMLLNSVKKNSYNLRYLDILSRLFFRKLPIRYQLNTIVAIHERDVSEIERIIEKYHGKNRIFIMITKLFFLATFTYITLPVWLIFTIIYYNFKNEHQIFK